MTSPIQHLASKGFTDPPWAQNERIVNAAGVTRWYYLTGFLAEHGMRDLAWLMVDGYDVRVHARSSQLSIRITRKDNR